MTKIKSQMTKIKFRMTKTALAATPSLSPKNSKIGETCPVT